MFASLIKVWEEWCLILWIILLSILSLMSLENVPNQELLNFDKFGHLFVYAILSFLCAKTASKYIDIKKSIIFSFLFANTYGLVIEYLQKTVTESRQFDLYDVLANLLGVFLGILIFLMFKK